MPSEDTKVLEFNQYQKSDKAPFIGYSDLECITENIDVCKNNPENSSTTKVRKHISLGFSMSLTSSFRGKDCMKKFCEFLILKRAGTKIIHFEKEKMELLTKEKQESNEIAKICYICKDKFETNI